MSTATTRQIATITKLLNTREHEDTGKTIRVGDTRFRTTTDKITTISKAVASRMIDALLDAPEKAVPTAPAHPHFTKSAIHPSRSAWVVANGHPDWKAGDIVEVRTASGGTRRVQLQGQGNFGLAEGKKYATDLYWDVIDAALVEQAPAVDETVEDTVEVEQDTIPEKAATPVAPERIATPRPVPARLQQEANRVTEAQGGRAAIYVRDGVKLARYSTQAEAGRAGWTVMTGLGAVVATGLDLAPAMEAASAHIADSAQRREVAYQSARQQAAGRGPAARAYAAGLGHGVSGQVWDDD